MSRHLRVNSETGVQNIGLKGINSQQIFYDDDDREKFLFYLARACKKYGVLILGFVLMSNHVHLVFEGEVKDFAKVFQSMGASFNRWYNIKYERTGTIYNARYYSKPIQNIKQILNLLIYVFRNPVKAGIVKDARAYEWSSLNETLSRNFSSIASVKRVDELLSIDYIARILKKKSELEDDEIFHIFPKYKPNNNSVLSRAKELFKGVVIRNFSRETEEKQRKLVIDLFEFGANVSQISRVSGINRRRIAYLCARVMQILKSSRFLLATGGCFKTISQILLDH